MERRRQIGPQTEHDTQAGGGLGWGEREGLSFVGCWVEVGCVCQELGLGTIHLEGRKTWEWWVQAGNKNEEIQPIRQSRKLRICDSFEFVHYRSDMQMRPSYQRLSQQLRQLCQQPLGMGAWVPPLLWTCVQPPLTSLMKSAGLMFPGRGR